jgi:hypothetical protein
MKYLKYILLPLLAVSAFAQTTPINNPVLTGTISVPAVTNNLTYVNSSHALVPLTLGSGLSLSSGTLTATSSGGAPVNNPTFTGTVTLPDGSYNNTSGTHFNNAVDLGLTAGARGTFAVSNMTSSGSVYLGGYNITNSLMTVNASNITIPSFAIGGTGILYTDSTGALNKVNIGSNLNFSGGTLSATGGGSGGVTSITATSPLTGGTITSTGSIGLSTSGVGVGTYTNSTVTVDSYGRITSASNGTAGAPVNSPTFTGTVTLPDGSYDTTSGMHFGGPVALGSQANASGTFAVNNLTSSGTMYLGGTGGGGGTTMIVNASSINIATFATGGYGLLYTDGSGYLTKASVGSGLSFSGGILSSTAGGGSVTSVATGTGLTGGTITTSGTISMQSAYAGNGIGNVNGIAKGNGSGTITAATAGSDYTSPSGSENLSNKTISNSNISSTNGNINVTGGYVALSSATGLPGSNGQGQLGAQASLGAELVGKGGIYDVTIFGSGGTAMAIPTGTNYTLHGGVDIGAHYTVSGLPAASSVQYGECFVSDAQESPGTSSGSSPTGGGSYIRKVYSDGSSWLLE